MLETSLNLKDGLPFHDMVYFPLKLDSLISVLISAIATTIIVSLSLIFKLYKQPTSLMVLTINIGHVLFYYSKLSVLIYQPLSDTHCKILGIFSVFGSQSSAIWGALFAHAFNNILKYQEISEIRLLRSLKYYLLIAVMIPAIMGGLSCWTDLIVYSNNYGTCVHRVYPDSVDTIGYIFIRVPVLIACVASIIWYKIAINKLSGLQGKRKSGDFYLFMIYPGIMVFCWGPHLTVQALVEFGAAPSQNLINVLIFVKYLQGFFDALVYGKSVVKVLRESVKSCLGKNVKDEEETLIESEDEEYRRDPSLTNYSQVVAGQESNFNKTL